MYAIRSYYACVGGAACPVMHFQYEWDEVGRLMRARRWDMPSSSGPARRLSASTEAGIRRLATQAYRVLGLSGYARIDLRLPAEGLV